MDNLNLLANLNRAVPKSFYDTDIGASAFSSVSLVESAYEQIRQEMEVLEVAIRFWKQRHNTLSIIARLPPEVLSTIFRCLAIAFCLRPGHSSIGWIKVTHVCTHWRRVALECPDLWTTIPFSLPRWAKEMLIRSKMAPLTIVASLYQSKRLHTELVHFAMLEMFRIQKLSLTVLQDSGNKNLLTGLARPAPLLESLSISCATPSVNILPKGIFSGEVPRLREVTLEKCILGWDEPFLCTLTTLKLVSIPVSARPSMDQLTSALSCMPDLRTLVLCNVLPLQIPLDPTVSTTRSVPLPCLTHLCIESDAPVTSFLMSHLIHPPNISIILTCTFRSMGLNPNYAIHDLKHVRSFCDILSKSQPVRSLAARYHAYPGSVRFSAYDVPGTYLRPPATAKVDLTMILGPPHSEVALAQLWADVWASVPVDDLESLHVIHTGSNTTTVHEWSNIFTFVAKAKLKNLRVCSESGIHCLEAFSPLETGRMQEQTPLKLPSLRNLAVERWDFGEYSGHRTCTELLKRCLKTRRKRRAAIKMLSLTDCSHITSDDVLMLETYVNVTWDGLENFTEDEDDEDEESDEYDEYY